MGTLVFAFFINNIHVKDVVYETIFNIDSGICNSFIDFITWKEDIKWDCVHVLPINKTITKADQLNYNLTRL